MEYMNLREKLWKRETKQTKNLCEREEIWKKRTREILGEEWGVVGGETVEDER
jgi:hypothetical protein